MLSLAGADIVDLPPPGRERSRILSADTEQKKLRHVAEIEADSTPVGPAVLPQFVSDDVALVGKSPCLQHVETLRQQRVRNPQVKVSRRQQDLRDRERRYFGDGQGPETAAGVQAPSCRYD